MIGHKKEIEQELGLKDLKEIYNVKDPSKTDWKKSEPETKGCRIDFKFGR